MSNFLDLRCPKCRDSGAIDIQASLWVRVTDLSTDADAAGDGSHHYTPESQAMCGACGHWANLSDFTPEER